ncbi:MAG TPA: FAD-dependent oxidoreductase, partial [Terrimicrobiaceae bacterium]|nr:FAD-dependent oxidoreductase [Terrimicrobiaceae bacterium]
MSIPVHDLVVYGATSAGIAAAVQGVRMGKSVIVIEPGQRIGGMTTCGLGDTDAGTEEAVGGVAREFYLRVGRKYGREEAVWMFEPSVALAVMEDLVRENRIRILFGERLDRSHGVEKSGTTVVSLTMESGLLVAGRMFLDAGYEGDLLAAAGVASIIGREANAQHGESQNGIRSENELPDGIDPYRTPGDPASGLLARVNPHPGGHEGDGDRKLQAYNFRMCLTDDPANCLP